MNEITGQDVSETRTQKLAEALFRASWRFNDGRRTWDIPIYSALSEESKQQLLDTAAACEVLLTEFPDESGQLLIWNCARTLFEAYHAHPYSSEPELPWDSSPKTVKFLWFQYGDAVVTEYYASKHLPSAKAFTQIKVGGKP